MPSSSAPTATLTTEDGRPSRRPPREEGRRVGIDGTLERLRTKILNGEIPPGTVISQTRMARDLGVSTTPLREVMRQLQSEGLLEAEFNRRPRVPALDVDDLHSVYATRILLESLGVSLTVPALDDADAAALAADLLEMRELAAVRDLPAWEVVHTRFHRRLVAGATPALGPTLASFFDRSERYRRLSVLRDVPRGWAAADQEHDAIVTACLARDGALAAAELAAHLARTAIFLSALVAPEADPVPVRHAVGLITASEPQLTGGPRRQRGAVAKPARR